MEIDKLNEWNPWWENAELTERLIGKERRSYSNLTNSIKIKEITIITGIRRSGKSTLMYQMIHNLIKNRVNPKHILFVNLEDKKLRDDTLDDIYLSYRENLNPNEKSYIFLDEVHRKEGWEHWIRKKYDLKTNDKFIISGSSSYLLKKEYSTLLTGRNLTFEVFPLSFEEFLSFKNLIINKNNLSKGIMLEQTKILIKKYLKEYITFGGFPEVFFKSEDYKTKILEQYFDDILYKDIIDRYNLNTQKIKDLALFLINNFTGQVSLRNVRNSLKISYDTIKDYLYYFREVFLFFLLDHFSYSFKEQKTIASKIYCIDNGLRNAVSFKFSRDEGKLAENLVYIELIRRKSNAFYWSKKNEVDFIIKNKNNFLTAINVSYTDDVPEREIKALLEFKKEYKGKLKELIIITKSFEKKDNWINYIPLWKWLLSE